jgi:hypothetical protein
MYQRKVRTPQKFRRNHERFPSGFLTLFCRGAKALVVDEITWCHLEICRRYLCSRPYFLRVGVVLDEPAAGRAGAVAGYFRD